MKHIKILSRNTLQDSIHTGACGECQTSCQSACKTSVTIGNQVCLQKEQK
ncbi:six-cysteine peptide SCIFF [Desulfuribacillus stibiiarsenatis]|uniref:Six-cysteine peptide SCIFF n=1 Tax=Desulfuribacillus stibiiarsenatis TaxID=1390249 RepID=A0A1E5L3Q1_9FIRM|nr:six-cysteine ranthipeptide SCIFF [Desulfuribacillus stibiiarsenatis]OEH84569.1 six-cysteine peptide SCIFF [Desulfuribacillus stibiiarsenatis]